MPRVTVLPLGECTRREAVASAKAEWDSQRSDRGRAQLYFTIPLLPTIAMPRVSASAEAPRILVVEDDPDIHQLLQDRLRAMGYRVQSAVDGVQALEAVRARERSRA